MSFGVAKTNIENYKLVQGLVSPAERPPTSAYTVSYKTSDLVQMDLSLKDSPPTTYKVLIISSSVFADSPVVYFNNTDNPTLTSSNDLQLLFLIKTDSNQNTHTNIIKSLFINPVIGSMRSWNVCSNVTNFYIGIYNLDNSFVDVASIGGFAGILNMRLDDTPINVSGMVYTNSIPIPMPISFNVTGNAVLPWSYFNTGAVVPNSVCLTGNTAATVTLGSALNLWSLLFGSKAGLPSGVALYVSTLAIINNTSQTITIASTAVGTAGGIVTVNGGSVNLSSKTVAEIKVVFTAKTATSATAVATITPNVVTGF